MLQSTLQSAQSQAKAKAFAGIQKISMKQRVKYSLVYILLFSLPAFLFTAPSWFNKDFGIDNRWFYILMQVFVLTAGCVHVYMMGKKFGWTNQYSLNQKLILTCTIILTTMVLQFIIIFFSKYYSALAFLFPTCMFIFLFPLLGITTFDYLISSPSPIYKVWKYPINLQMPDLDMVDFSNAYIVTFELKKKITDDKMTVMKFKAPPDKLAFGDLFYLYMYEYNEKNRDSMIEFVNQQQRHYDWQFYIKPKGFWSNKKYIDSALTVRENKIAENNLIVAERAFGE
jgi:hypothetical protein